MVRLALTRSRRPVIAPERGQPGVEFAGDRQQPGSPLGHDDALGGERRIRGRSGRSAPRPPRIRPNGPGLTPPAG